MRHARRPALLILAVIAGGGANDIGLDDAYGASRFEPSGAFGAYLTGRFAVQRTDLEVAADKLEAASARDGSVREVATQAFIAATLAGRPTAALMAAGLPDNPVAQLVLADREALSGNWDRAEAGYAALPQQGLTQVLRPLLIAWSQAGAGRTDAALATLQTILDGQRFRGVVALHAAMIADLGGRVGAAGPLYQTALAEYGSPNLRLGMILASWQARHGTPGEAAQTIRTMTGVNGDLALARTALEAQVSAPAVRNAADGIAEAYLAMAATLRQQNSPDSALVLLQLALTLRPDFTAARLLLADVQEGAKRGPSALATLSAVPANDPLFAVVQLRRAALMDNAGQTEEAVALLNGLAAEHPDRPEPLAQLGDLLRRKSRFPEAAAAFDRAIARVAVPTRNNWPLFYERGIAFERSGNWAKAEADFEYALQLAPEQPSVLNYLGYSWTEQNRNLDRARSMIERAAALRPNDGAILDSLGWVLLRQGDKEGALANLERAAQLQPEDGVINGHFGDALQAVGRLREAEFQWRRALNLKLEPDDQKRIEQKIRELPQ